MHPEENVEANQYVFWMIFFTETACYERQLPKCFGVMEKTDGNGREITIARANEFDWERKIDKECKSIMFRISFRNFMQHFERAIQK